MTRTEWRDRKRYLWLIAAGDAGAAVRRGRAERLHRLGRLAVARPDRDPRGRAARRPARRPRPLEPARRRSSRPWRPTATTAGSPSCSCPLQYAGFLLCVLVPAAPATSPWRPRSASRSRSAIIGGLGINTAHELGHKRESHERWLAKVALAQRSTATSTSSTTAATTSGWPRPRTRPAAASARASTRSGRAPWSARVRSAWRLEQRRLHAPPPAASWSTRQRRAQRLG